MFRISPTLSVAAALTACVFVQFAGVSAAQPKRPAVLDAPPADTGRRITENGLVANYFPAQQRAPAVLTLSGSVGGLTMNDMSVALQAERFTVLHLSYFRGPGQNQNAELIPLEYFDTALVWLRRQSEADPARMGIVGVSKGAEAALVLAVRHPEHTVGRTRRCWHMKMRAILRSACLCRPTIHVSQPVAEQIEGIARRDRTVGRRRSHS
jgi:uncharacterized protein